MSKLRAVPSPQQAQNPLLQILSNATAIPVPMLVIIKEPIIQKLTNAITVRPDALHASLTFTFAQAAELAMNFTDKVSHVHVPSLDSGLLSSHYQL